MGYQETKNSKISLKISIKGFKHLRPVARKTRCRVRIVEKRGLPFIVSRYKERKTFVLGLAVFVVLFILCCPLCGQLRLQEMKM